MKLKNSKLIEARKRLGLFQRQVADAIGVHLITYHYYENFKTYPNLKMMIKIISFYKNRGIDLNADEIFPEEFKKPSRKKRKTLEFKLSSINQEGLTVPCKTEPIEQLLENEYKEALREYLKKLTPKQVKVLSLKYGITGKKPMSCSEIGKKMNFSRAYISYIVNDALRHLYILFKQDGKI